MNYQQVGELLAYVAAFDRRTTGRSDVLAWHDVLGDLDYDACKAAVRTWYTDQAGWIMPSHIRNTVLGRPGGADRLPSAVPLRDHLTGRPELDPDRNLSRTATIRAALAARKAPEIPT